VLIVGGDRCFTDAEVFDPATNQSSMVGSLSVGRYGHTATLLPDGRVLIVGGRGGLRTTAVSEIYDPVARTFQVVGSLSQDRAYHGAALLRDGRVLVVGGEHTVLPEYTLEPLDSAEIFDPATGTFSATGSMETPRTGLSQSGIPVLSDGTVLVVSGGDAELFVPWWDDGRGQFRPAGELITPRMGHTVTLLANSGQVLVAGGYTWDEAQQAYVTIASTEYWNGEERTFEHGPSMLDPRQQHTATPLPDGDRVVVIGGRAQPNSDWGLSWEDLFVRR
jgi:hypothetical protein